MVVRRDDRTFPLRPEVEGAILAEVSRGASMTTCSASRPGSLPAPR